MPSIDLTPRDVERLFTGPEAQAIHSIKRRKARQADREARQAHRLAMQKAKGEDVTQMRHRMKMDKLRGERQAIRESEAQTEFKKVIADVLEVHGKPRAAAEGAEIVYDDDGVPVKLNFS